MYTMGFYWLYEGIHQRFDSARGKFFWEEMRNKYHMIKWEALDKPKCWNISELPTSHNQLKLWAELVGACNSIWYRSQRSRVRILVSAIK